MGSWIPYMSIADYKGVDKTSSNRQIPLALGSDLYFLIWNKNE